MQNVSRLILLPLFAAGLTGAAWAAEGTTDTGTAETPKASEYTRADTNFYGRGDLTRAHPSAIIIPLGGYTKGGDSYFFTPKIKAPREMYVETLNDWIEPITPPGATSLGIAPDAMQIREPQGDVQVALPSAPANYAPVTDSMTIPNGAVVKTGANGTAAVLFGGVDSARLMPNSEAAVQQTVTAQARSVEVDLTTGGVFSKVGTQVGVKGGYEVHTPSGNASAPGGDFVTIISGSRTDVWLAQGTVTLENPAQTKSAATETSDGKGPLKILRDPGLADPHQSFQADTETLTDIMNFIPMANQKIKALRDKLTGGATLSDNEQAYLKRIKQVPALIHLALVAPPAPVIVPLVTPPVISATPPPAKLERIDLNLRADGSVDFQGATLTLDELKSKLADIAKATPTQSLFVKGRELVSRDQLRKVLAICKAAKLKTTVAKAAPLPSTPPPAPTPPPPPTAEMPPPAPAAPPTAETPPPAPAVTPTAETPAPEPPAPTGPAPIRTVVRVDGKINFQGATYELPEFKKKLEALVMATPDQAIVIHAGKTVTYDKIKAVFDLCRDANVQYISAVTATPPATPTGSEPAATNLPAPALIMHPSMEPTPPPPASQPENPPATNAPPAAGP